MANTYTQLTIHGVFAVQGRENIIGRPWRDELHRYISGIIGSHGKSLAVNGWRDHVHILFGMPPDTSVSKMMQLVKTNSSKWINERGFIRGKFSWQEGYGGFSVSRSQRDRVIRYIMDQEEHHRQKTFREEYLQMLKDFDVAYDDKYLFEFYE